MAKVKVAEAFQGVRRVFLDTAPVIYALENDATFGPLAWEALEHCLQKDIKLVASPITLAECLAGTADPSLMRSFVELLTGSEVDFESLNDLDAFQAGVMRRSSTLTLSDCLQIACSIRARCDLLLTNDQGLRQAARIQILCLSDLEL